MTAEDMTMQALRKQVSELTLRLKKLGDENRDLREICNENGIQYVERLAARRHKRYFAQLCDEHPIGETANASDALGAANIVRGIAECAGSVLRTGLIARCFFVAFTYLTAQFPWRFGGRLIATFEGHEDIVESVAVLEGGRLASGSWDKTIKVWEVATGACVTTLEGHSDWVNSVVALEGGRLASASMDMTMKIWELGPGECIATLGPEADKGGVYSMVALEGGRLAIRGADMNNVRGAPRLYDATRSDDRVLI